MRAALERYETPRCVGHTTAAQQTSHSGASDAHVHPIVSHVLSDVLGRDESSHVSTQDAHSTSGGTSAHTASTIEDSEWVSATTKCATTRELELSFVLLEGLVLLHRPSAPHIDMSLVFAVLGIDVVGLFAVGTPTHQLRETCTDTQQRMNTRGVQSTRLSATEGEGQETRAQCTSDGPCTSQTDNGRATHSHSHTQGAHNTVGEEWERKAHSHSHTHAHNRTVGGDESERDTQVVQTDNGRAHSHTPHNSTVGEDKSERETLLDTLTAYMGLREAALRLLTAMFAGSTPSMCRRLAESSRGVRILSSLLIRWSGAHNNARAWTLHSRTYMITHAHV